MTSIEYLIREQDGEFVILIKGYTIEGRFWWKRKVWGWHSTNAWGGVRQTKPLCVRPEPLSQSFNSLEEARNQIKKWLNPSIPKYHKG